MALSYRDPLSDTVGKRMIVSGPDYIKDHLPRVHQHSTYIGEKRPALEKTGDLSYLCRPAPNRSLPARYKHEYAGGIGWGIPEFSCINRSNLESGLQLKHGELSLYAVDKLTHRYQNPCRIKDLILLPGDSTDHKHGLQLQQEHGPRQDPRRQPGPWTSTWPQVAEQAAHMSMAPCCSPDHRHLHGPRGQGSPQALTWFQQAAQPTGINMALDGNPGHRQPHRYSRALDPGMAPGGSADLDSTMAPGGCSGHSWQYDPWGSAAQAHQHGFRPQHRLRKFAWS